MKKNKILLIDDNVDMLLIGERVFAAAGFEYFSARSGEEALERLKAEAVDVILLDYILPDINGAQFLDCIAQQPEYAHVRKIPVIVLTAHPEIIDDLYPYHEYGLRAILHKPFGHRELLNLVENILLQEKWQRAADSRSQRTAMKQTSALDDEEGRSALATISRLAADLISSSATALEEQQLLDLEAIHTTSKRLLRMLNRKSAENKLVETETLFS